MAKKDEVKKEEEVKEEVKELQPKPDCPICKGAGKVVLIPGSKFEVACTCKYK